MERLNSTTHNPNQLALGRCRAIRLRDVLRSSAAHRRISRAVLAAAINEVQNRHNQLRVFILEAKGKPGNPVEPVEQVVVLGADRAVWLSECEVAIWIFECPLTIHRIVHGRNERIDFLECLSPNLDGFRMPDVAQLVASIDPSGIDVPLCASRVG